MPVLRELHVYLERSDTDKTIATPIRIASDFNASFPLLSSARFDCMAVPWPPSLCMSRMRSLTLRDCKALDRTLTFDRFLDVLEECKELEDLRLHRFISTFSHHVPADFARTIILPRLQRLTLREAPSLCSQFLSAVELPPTIALRVFGIIDRGLNPNEARGLFPSMLPADENRLLPVIRTATHGTLHGCGLFTITVCLWSGRAAVYSPSAGPIMLTLDWDRNSVTEVYTPRALEDFTALFAKAPLEVVEIGCDLLSMPDSTSDIWSTMFATFRAVRTLTVHPGNSTVQPLCSALAGEELPLLEVDEDEAREFCPVLLPKLRRLRMEYVKWNRDAMGHILESLRRGAMRGLPKLRKLTVMFFAASST